MSKGVGINFKTPTPFAEYIPWFKNCIANDLRSLPLKHLTKKAVEINPHLFLFNIILVLHSNCFIPIKKSFGRCLF